MKPPATDNTLPQLKNPSSLFNIIIQNFFSNPAFHEQQAEFVDLVFKLLSQQPTKLVQKCADLVLARITQFSRDLQEIGSTAYYDRAKKLADFLVLEKKIRSWQKPISSDLESVDFSLPRYILIENYTIVHNDLKKYQLGILKFLFILSTITIPCTTLASFGTTTGLAGLTISNDSIYDDYNLAITFNEWYCFTNHTSPIVWQKGLAEIQRIMHENIKFNANMAWAGAVIFSAGWLPLVYALSSLLFGLELYRSARLFETHWQKIHRVTCNVVNHPVTKTAIYLSPLAGLIWFLTQAMASIQHNMTSLQNLPVCYTAGSNESLSLCNESVSACSIGNNTVNQLYYQTQIEPFANFTIVGVFIAFSLFALAFLIKLCLQTISSCTLSNKLPRDSIYSRLNDEPVKDYNTIPINSEPSKIRTIEPI